VSLKLITPPSTEPVTLAQAKFDCRVDNTGDVDFDALQDENLLGLIKTCTEACEHIIGRAIMPQTWELVLDAFPYDSDIELAHPPVQSITSIKYVANNAELTLATDKYTLDNEKEPCWVLSVDGFPATDDVANAVRVRYLAGYANVDAVPYAIKQWIRSAVQYMHCNCDAGGLPAGFNSGLLDRVRIWGF